MPCIRSAIRKKDMCVVGCHAGKGDRDRGAGEHIGSARHLHITQEREAGIACDLVELVLDIAHLRVVWSHAVSHEPKGCGQTLVHVDIYAIFARSALGIKRMQDPRSGIKA